MLRGIDLALGGGECVALVGPNGAGKTTLALAVLGALRLQRGELLLDGRSIEKMGGTERARFMAYVPQVLDRVPAFTVRDVVAGGRFAWRGWLGAHAREDRRAIDEALAICGLGELAERTLDTLSGGERQKTMLAAAMAQEACLLLLDEPNTALDPAYQLELVRILREWQRADRALLVISHDLQLPAALGGRVVALHEGQVVADGSVAEVLVPATLGRIYGAAFGVATTADGTQVVLPEWWLRR